MIHSGAASFALFAAVRMATRLESYAVRRYKTERAPMLGPEMVID